MGVILEPSTSEYSVKELEQDLCTAFREKGYGYHASPDAEAGVMNIVAVKEAGGLAFGFKVAVWNSMYDNGYSGPQVGFIETDPAVPGASKSPLTERHALLDKGDAADFVESLDRFHAEGKTTFTNNLNKFPLFPY
jgi:hypothetical protein